MTCFSEFLVYELIFRSKSKVAKSFRKHIYNLVKYLENDHQQLLKDQVKEFKKKIDQYNETNKNRLSSKFNQLS